MPSAVRRPYDVGYGKTPPQTRFKKGQSGNPRGRPKTVKNVDAKIAIELNRFMTVNQDGNRSAITKREAIILQLFKKAIQGDPRALEIVLTELRKIEPKSRSGKLGFTLNELAWSSGEA
jgi:hypothetical protein